MPGLPPYTKIRLHLLPEKAASPQGRTPTKKFRVGAGVGHSANNQAVAVGIGYAPTERLRLNTKISTTTNSTKSNRSNGISIGASYDLDW